MTAVLAVVVAVIAMQSPLSASASPCSNTAARRAILASSLSSFYKQSARSAGQPGAGGPYVRYCRDFTRDGRPDMVVPFASGGTAGDVAWVVFRGSPTGWKLALARRNLYKLGVFPFRGDLVQSQPVYAVNDPNCCPSGGFDHVRFHWNGSRFVAVRRWHDRRPTP